MLATEETSSAVEAGSQAAPATLVGSELRRLALHSSHYLAGLVGGLAFGLLSFPIFTRAFSVAEYGIIDLAQKFTLLLTIASKAGLQNAALRFHNERQFAADKGAAQRYYSTMLFGVLCTSACVAPLFLAVVGLTSDSLISGPLAKLTYFILALAVLRALSAILWAFLRIEERTKAFNATAVGTKAATIVAICALLPWAGRTSRTYFAGMIVVEAALVAALTLSQVRRGMLAPSRFDRDLFRAAVAYSMPLVFYEFAFGVLVSADRFLVRHYLGAEALGFYSVAYGLAQHANDLLIAPLSLAIMPIYMRIWTTGGAEKTSHFLATALDLFLMGAAGLLAAAAASSNAIVVLLASSKYAGADRLVPVLLAGLLIYATSVFLAAGLLIHKRTLQMASFLVLTAAFDVGLNCVLLPRLGLLGGALATLASYSLCIVLLGRASNRLLPLQMNARLIAKYLAAAALAWMAGSQVQLGTPALDLLGRSALALTVYAAGLYALDDRVRHATRWAIAWRRSRSW